jgi:hypothetical protein
MLRIAMVALLLAALAVPAEAKGGGARGTGSNPSSHSVKGYTKKDGTTVRPHHQTNPNGTQRDNYNARGNYNPHNGQTGTRTPQY